MHVWGSRGSWQHEASVGGHVHHVRPGMDGYTTMGKDGDMKRQTFKASVWRANELLSEGVAYAHNSGVRKSEALVREFARDRGVMMYGEQPNRDDEGYTRIWRSSDGQHELVACVIPV